MGREEIRLFPPTIWSSLCGWQSLNIFGVTENKPRLRLIRNFMHETRKAGRKQRRQRGTDGKIFGSKVEASLYSLCNLVRASLLRIGGKVGSRAVRVMELAKRSFSSSSLPLVVAVFVGPLWSFIILASCMIGQHSAFFTVKWVDQNQVYS